MLGPLNFSESVPRTTVCLHLWFCRPLSPNCQSVPVPLMTALHRHYGQSPLILASGNFSMLCLYLLCSLGVDAACLFLMEFAVVWQCWFCIGSCCPSQICDTCISHSLFVAGVVFISASSVFTTLTWAQSLMFCPYASIWTGWGLSGPRGQQDTKVFSMTDNTVSSDTTYGIKSPFRDKMLAGHDGTCP